MFIKVFLLIVFFAVTITVGLKFRKRASDIDGFVLGGRAVGPWLSAFAYGTSYFSAVVFVGYAGQFGWRFGISALWIGLGNAFIGSLLPWVILGRRTRIMTRFFSSKTMPEFFGSRYASNALKIGASIIVFIFLIPYTASLYNGLSRLFEMAFHIDFTYCVVAMAVITAVYVIAGGYFATAVNDFIQGIIMLIGIVAVISAVLNNNGGFTAALTELAHKSGDTPATQIPGIFASIFGPEPLNLLGVVILTSLGTWGLPQMVQKFYSIKSESAILKGTVISSFFALIVAGGCYFLGGFGRLYPDVFTGNFDAIIPGMLSGLSNVLIGVVMILVLSASMSTLSSLVMTSASTLTIDFLKGNVIKKMDEKEQLLTIRLLIVVFIIISSAIAIVQYTSSITFIAQLMGVSWGALAGSFLAPFIYGLYWKKATKASVWCCFIFSSGIMILNILFRSSFPAVLQSPINAGAFVMLAGLVIVPLVSSFTKAPPKKKVELDFSCYDEKVTVNLKQTLGSKK